MYVFHFVRLKGAEKCTKQAYQHIPTYSISKSFRHTQSKNQPDYIYGELFTRDFIFLLSLIAHHQKKPLRVIDLGCGDAKLLFTAAHYFKNTRFLGVEIVPELSEIATKVASRALIEIQKRNNFIDIMNGDFTILDLTSQIHACDILYTNSAALSEHTWRQLQAKFQRLKSGSCLISVERKIDLPDFECVYIGRHAASWGNAIVRCYVKIQ